jgi:hypothetical protein
MFGNVVKANSFLDSSLWINCTNRPPKTLLIYSIYNTWGSCVHVPKTTGNQGSENVLNYKYCMEF